MMLIANELTNLIRIQSGVLLTAAYQMRMETDQLLMNV